MAKGRFKKLVNNVAKKLSNAGGWVGGAAKFVDNIIPDDDSPQEQKKAQDAKKLSTPAKEGAGKLGVKLWLSNMWAKPAGKVLIIGVPVLVVFLIIVAIRSASRNKRHNKNRR